MNDTLKPEELDRICEAHLFSLPYFRGMLRAVEHSLIARIDLPEPYLDVGAGDGHFYHAALRDKLCLGIDPWLAPLEEASSLGDYGLLTQADGKFIPLADGSLPAALSNSVLEHIPGVQEVLQEVGRVLAPGGIFVFTVPNQRFRTDLWGMKFFNALGLSGLANRYEHFFNRIARHVNLDPPEVWLKRLQEAGFSQVEYQHYFPVWAMQMLERGHAAGLPNLLWKKTLGKWVLFPSRRNPFIPFRKIRALLNDPLTSEGTCTLYIARRDS